MDGRSLGIVALLALHVAPVATAHECEGTWKVTAEGDGGGALGHTCGECGTPVAHNHTFSDGHTSAYCRTDGYHLDAFAWPAAFALVGTLGIVYGSRALQRRRRW